MSGFDTEAVHRLVYWIREREAIRRKKDAGQPAPWTDDPILQQRSFCNVHREHDRGTRWLAANWREPHADCPDLWFAMVVARFVNWPDTLAEIGYPVPWDRERFLSVMAARKERDEQCYGGAYMIRADKAGQDKPHYQVEKVFNPLWRAHEKVRPRKGEQLAEWFGRLSEFHGLGGGFMAAQVVADLKYVAPLRAANDWWDWAAWGPGSRRGMYRVLGWPLPRDKQNAPWRGGHYDWLTKLRALQEQIAPKLERVGIGRLCAQDLQNCLCEFDKWERTRLGEGKPTLYRPSTAPLPGAATSLPPAFAIPTAAVAPAAGETAAEPSDTEDDGAGADASPVETAESYRSSAEPLPGTIGVDSATKPETVEPVMVTEVVTDELVTNTLAVDRDEKLAGALAEFARLGRADKYGERKPPQPPDTRARYLSKDGELTAERLYRHLNGGPHLGMYLMSALSTRIAVFDLDDHDGTTDPETMRSVALSVRAAAFRHGIGTWPVRSGGGRGVHLCAKWEQPQPARDVRAAMIAVLAEVGLRDGAGGIEKGEVEVFPKQDAVASDGSGSLIALPFGRASVPLDEEMRPVERALPWLSATPPPAAPSEPERTFAGDPTAPIGDIIAALAVIPNDADTDFEVYIAVGMAVAAASGGSEEGLAAWDEWASRRVDDYPDQSRDVRKRWDYWLRRPPARTGFGALVKRAREHTPGWLPPSQPAPYLSEQWLALGFVADHRDDMRYTALWNQWHIWDGSIWRRDDTLRAFSLAAAHCRDTARTINKAAVARKMNDARTRAAVLSLARENPALAAVHDQWDRDPWLLGTPGGTVDLRTGELRASRPEDYITKTTAVAPSGDCPLWKAKLLEICGGDGEVVGFLRRWYGYCLTGLTREEKLLFFLGEGGNGKGTVIETIAYVMGDYAAVVPMTTLVKRRHPEHPTEIAKLHGIRYAVASETDDGARINAAMMKLLTGGDALTGRFMRADFFDFRPTHKLVISGNRALILGRVDRALGRRWEQVPFTEEFEPDVTLKERLRQEGGGILAWQIEGCMEWKRLGLAPPKAIVEATEEYLREQDDIALFIEEECRLDQKEKISARALYDEWRSWCQRNSIYPGKLSDFVDRVKKRGFIYKIPQNRGVFEGIALGQVFELPEDPNAPETLGG